MDRFYTRNIFNGFFEHNYSSGNFSVTGGFLVAVNSHLDNKVSIFPGIDISQKFLGQKLKIYGSLNRSLRIPTFTDLFYRDPSNEGNRDLAPEEQFSIEAGTVFASGRSTSNLAFFRDQGTHVIDWVWIPENSLYRAMNISEVTTRGIEIEYRYKNSQTAPSFRLDAFGFSYAFIDLEKASAGYESKYSLDYLKHNFHFNISQNLLKNLNADLRISYISRNGSYLDYDPAEGEFSVPFEPYLLTDLKFTFVAGIFDLFININNLFDVDYTDVGNLIQPGRWITGGLKVNILTSKIR
jgi:iron complex outermembrane receptor protein